jgi:hypothetical protein
LRTDQADDYDFLGLLLELYRIIPELLQRHFGHAHPNDLGQVNITSENFDHHISTPITPVLDLAPGLLIAAILNACQSGLSLSLEDEIVIETVLYRTVSGPALQRGIRGGARNPAKVRKQTTKKFIAAAAQLPKVPKKPFIEFNATMKSKRKTSIVVINSDGKDCMPRAIVVAIGSLKLKLAIEADPNMSEEAEKELIRAYERLKYRSVKTNVFGSLGEQSARTRDLCVKAGFEYPLKDPCGFGELKKFENASGYNVRVVAADFCNETVYDGLKENRQPFEGRIEDHVIYLMRSKKSAPGVFDLDEEETADMYHFDAIVNPQGYFEKKKFCIPCNKAYEGSTYGNHACSDIEDFCFTCWDRYCCFDETLSSQLDATSIPLPRPPLEACTICGKKFRSPKCKERHIKAAQCVKFVYCFDCRKNIPRGLNDEDGSLLSNKETLAGHKTAEGCKKHCRVCKKDDVTLDHLCFLQSESFKPASEKMIFFDFETDASSGKHIPVYCHAKWYNMINSTWEHVEFNHQDRTLEEFCIWLFNEKRKGYTAIAHNMQGFDGCFILRYLVENGCMPEVILKGRKIVHIVVPKIQIRIIDSLNFLSMKLASFPAAFDFEAQKGYFPHFFTKPANYEYRGCMPPREDYGVNSMADTEFMDFTEWYNEQVRKNTQFDFAKEMKMYCRQDVDILQQGCLQFKMMVMNVTEGACDPFQYDTLPSVCGAVYRNFFMIATHLKDKIAAVPPAGYGRHHRYSNVSMEWLEWLVHTKQVEDLQHALNSPLGEAKFDDYYVDGYSPSTSTIYEFNGCHFHACLKCHPDNRQAKHTHYDMTFDAVYKKTFDRCKELEKMTRDGRKVKVVTMWECEWTAQKKGNPEIVDFVEKNKERMKPLSPFVGFHGGRTETFRLLIDKSQGLKLKYADINSLYPYINYTKEYPVGHPSEIIRRDFKPLSSYFGFIRCKVLPPRELLMPVLPGKYGKEEKLIFALCRTCAETRNTTTSCNHSVDERCLTNTWFSEELKLAEKKGYIIQEMYSVYHFEERSDQLFKDYIRTFLRIKSISSGKPKDIERVIKQLKEKYEIDVKASDFKDNPSMRSLAKLFLNALWGKFGTRRNLPQSLIVNSFDKLTGLLNDPSIEVLSTVRLNNEALLVSYCSIDMEYQDINNCNNIYIACATTAYARMELYEQLDFLGDRVVYCDTDSIIYVSEEGKDIPNGDLLGEWKDELKDNDFIVEFVSGGPKNYAYRTAKGHYCIKVKGFSLTHENRKTFTFEAMKRVVESFAFLGSEEGDEEYRTIRLMTSKEREEHNKLQRNRANMFLHQLDSSIPSSVADDTFISVYEPRKIVRNKYFELANAPMQKLYTVNYDKRVVCLDYTTRPFGY